MKNRPDLLGGELLDHRYPNVEGRKLIVVFSMAGIYFGLKVDHISEILQVEEIMGGDEGEGFLGFVSVRGKKIPILDFRRYFGLGKDSDSLEDNLGIKSLLVLKHDLEDSDKNLKMGIIVDHIEGVEEEGKFNSFPFPEIAKNEATDVYQALLMKMEDMIILLDVSYFIDRASPSH